MKSIKPKIEFAYFHFFVFVFLFFSLLAGHSKGQDFRSVHDGIEYAQLTYMIGNDPVKINLLRLDLAKVGLNVHHAFDKAIGVEPTSAIGKRHGASAAINAGFFRLDKSEFVGEASGLLMIDGELISESSLSRIALVLHSCSDKTYYVDFSHIDAFPRFYHHRFPVPEIKGINRERREGEAVLYSSYFGPTTRTNSKGAEIILDKCKKTLCRSIALYERAGNSAIPVGGYVVSLDSELIETHQDFIDRLKLVLSGKKQDRVLQVLPAILGTHPNLRLDRHGRRDSLDIVAGVPQLIKDGKIDITWEQEKASKSFAEMRHPRTAVAKLKDGKFLMITVDGRQPGVSVGMNLQELAEYLLSLGATDAMNLDGGGSTTMFLDGKVVNTPSDKEGERKVSDAIVVTLRKNVRR